MFIFGPQSKTYQQTCWFFYQSKDRTKNISAAVLFLDKTGNFNVWDILIFQKIIAVHPRLPEWEPVYSLLLPHQNQKGLGWSIWPSVNKHFVKKTEVRAADRKLERKGCSKQGRDKLLLFVASYLDGAWSLMVTIIWWKESKNHFSLPLRHLSACCDRNMRAVDTNRLVLCLR